MSTDQESADNVQTHRGGELPGLRREKDGRLTFVPADGAELVRDCRVVRCFPWSVAEQYISIRNPNGEEVFLLHNLEDLAEASLVLLRDELDQIDFVPRITKVYFIDDTFDVSIWRVDTNRGPIEFQVKHDEDVRLLDHARVVIRDHRGMLFEIPSLGGLDEVSRGFVEDRLS